MVEHLWEDLQEERVHVLILGVALLIYGVTRHLLLRLMYSKIRPTENSENFTPPVLPTVQQIRHPLEI